MRHMININHIFLQGMSVNERGLLLSTSTTCSLSLAHIASVAKYEEDIGLALVSMKVYI